MKKLLLAAALAFSVAVPAFAEITATDVVGRTVTVPKVPERIVLGFYYEDYLAIGGKDGGGQGGRDRAFHLERLAAAAICAL